MGSINSWGRGEPPPRPPKCPTCGSFAIPPRHQAEIIKWHRERMGLTQAALGERVGVKAHQVGNWEREGVDSLFRCRQLAGVFGIALLELIGE